MANEEISEFLFELNKGLKKIRIESYNNRRLFVLAITDNINEAVNESIYLYEATQEVILDICAVYLDFNGIIIPILGNINIDKAIGSYNKELELLLSTSEMLKEKRENKKKQYLTFADYCEMGIKPAEDRIK